MNQNPSGSTDSKKSEGFFRRSPLSSNPGLIDNASLLNPLGTIISNELSPRTETRLKSDSEIDQELSEIANENVGNSFNRSDQTYVPTRSLDNVMRHQPEREVRALNQRPVAQTLDHNEEFSKIANEDDRDYFRRHGNVDVPTIPPANALSFQPVDIQNVDPNQMLSKISNKNSLDYFRDLEKARIAGDARVARDALVESLNYTSGKKGVTKDEPFTKQEEPPADFK